MYGGTLRGLRGRCNGTFFKQHGVFPHFPLWLCDCVLAMFPALFWILAPKLMEVNTKKPLLSAILGINLPTGKQSSDYIFWTGKVYKCREIVRRPMVEAQCSVQLCFPVVLKNGSMVRVDFVHVCKHVKIIVNLCLTCSGLCTLDVFLLIFSLMLEDPFTFGIILHL